MACIIHIPIGLSLIIAVIGLRQLDIGRLGKHGFDLIELASQIGIIRQFLCNVALLVYVVSTSCAHCCFV